MKRIEKEKYFDRLQKIKEDIHWHKSRIFVHRKELNKAQNKLQKTLLAGDFK